MTEKKTLWENVGDLLRLHDGGLLGATQEPWVVKYICEETEKRLAELEAGRSGILESRQYVLNEEAEAWLARIEALESKMSFLYENVSDRKGAFRANNKAIDRSHSDLMFKVLRMQADVSGDNPSPVGDKTPPTDTTTGGTATGYTVKKAWNPATDGFWYWDFLAGMALFAEPYYGNASIKDEPLISIGNCFQTREEAEDEGKWRFETKLVLDEKLRKEGVLYVIKNCLWCHVTKAMVVYPDRNVPRSDFNQTIGFLGSDAKRYLTGEK